MDTVIDPVNNNVNSSWFENFPHDMTEIPCHICYFEPTFLIVNKYK
jgi:hypothetical protein